MNAGAAPVDAPPAAVANREQAVKEAVVLLLADSVNSEAPAGPRAEVTRRNVLDAALAVFARDGYSQSSVQEIATLAGVKVPTIYQYFNGRPGLFACVAGERAIEMLTSGVDHWDVTQGREGLRRAIESHVSYFDSHRSWMKAMEEAVHVEPSIARLRREFRTTHKARFGKAIAKGQRLGIVKSSVSSDVLARALTQGIDRFLFDAFIFDPPTEALSVDQVSAELTSIWGDALCCP
ncbi:TetR/AcrR family transcriptional regulator [Ilumatobacter nonamiensis]|uniref:TetR/AcrR family transcriptional regulator n=1 Tax=Ilumatobacter nonamiensis TaxID=467093 RepID=UPI00058C55CB|nr:TetR/AcrR family transcriptional regulator [Ilumatobacter nonamiensis]